jgi:hypothetical protein
VGRTYEYFIGKEIKFRSEELVKGSQAGFEAPFE